MKIKEIIRCKKCQKAIEEYDIDVRDGSQSHWCWDCWDKNCDELRQLDKQTEYRKGKNESE